MLRRLLARAASPLLPQRALDDRRALVIAGGRGVAVRPRSRFTCLLVREAWQLFRAATVAGQVYDLTDPRSPVYVSSVLKSKAFTPTGGVAIAAAGTALYIAGGCGILAFDATDPFAPAPGAQ